MEDLISFFIGKQVRVKNLGKEVTIIDYHPDNKQGEFTVTDYSSKSLLTFKISSNEIIFCA